MLKLIGTIAMACLLYACAGGGFNLPPVTEGEGTDLPGKIVWADLFVDALQGKLRLRVYVTGVCNLKGYAEISSVSALPIYDACNND